MKRRTIHGSAGWVLELPWVPEPLPSELGSSMMMWRVRKVNLDWREWIWNFNGQVLCGEVISGMMNRWWSCGTLEEDEIYEPWMTTGEEGVQKGIYIHWNKRGGRLAPGEPNDASTRCMFYVPDITRRTEELNLRLAWLIETLHKRNDWYGRRIWQGMSRQWWNPCAPDGNMRRRIRIIEAAIVFENIIRAPRISYL